jgi:hypothetical protein
LRVRNRRWAVGMDPAFTEPRKWTKERYIEAVSSMRIPYVGIGG